MGSNAARNSIKLTISFWFFSKKIKYGFIILSKFFNVSLSGSIVSKFFNMSVFKFVNILPLPNAISDFLTFLNKRYKYSFENLDFGKYNHPSWIQLSSPNILGIPGVALFDRIRLPAFKYTVFFKPDSLIYSFIFRIYGASFAVASDIFSQCNPLSAMKSWIGLGEPPLLISTKSPIVPFAQVSGFLLLNGSKSTNQDLKIACACCSKLLFIQ